MVEHGGGGPGTARPVGPDDAAEVARLAVCMYQELGAEAPADGGWERWAATAADVVRARLGHDVVLFAVDDPGRPGGLVSCGAGTVWTRLPNPWYGDPRVGYIQWMSTDPGHRRRGHSRAVLRALLDWFDARAIHVVELHASTMGEPLYRSEGFDEGVWGVALRRRPFDPPPERPPEPEA
jgi:GNAT superfamily N-acetyltransferase